MSAHTPTWDDVLAAGVKAQRLIPGSVAVGGTACALYARHRFSQDTDHLVPGLKDRYEDVRSTLEQSREWKTARLQPPVLILGSIDGVQVGFRQPRRMDTIATMVIETGGGPLVVPTLDELIGMKAYLAYSRNALRDYLDLAALSGLAPREAIVASLLQSDARYGHLQTSSVALEIAKALSDPHPFDLDQIDLGEYKDLSPEWRSWPKIKEVCKQLGSALGEALISGEPS
jgi:hypothetical protein